MGTTEYKMNCFVLENKGLTACYLSSTTTVWLTCPIRPEEPIDHIEPSATSRVAPKSDNTVWVWLSPQSSECFPGTLVETRDPDRTTDEVRNEYRRRKNKRTICDRETPD